MRRAHRKVCVCGCVCICCYNYLSPSTPDCFAQDFFLTYPAFITISELCEGLRKRYHGMIVRSSGGETPASINGGESTDGESEDQEILRKRR